MATTFFTWANSNFTKGKGDFFGDLEVFGWVFFLTD
jgi:hypothetical protein